MSLTKKKKKLGNELPTSQHTRVILPPTSPTGAPFFSPSSGESVASARRGRRSKQSKKITTKTRKKKSLGNGIRRKDATEPNLPVETAANVQNGKSQSQQGSGRVCSPEHFSGGGVQGGAEQRPASLVPSVREEKRKESLEPPARTQDTVKTGNQKRKKEKVLQKSLSVMSMSWLIGMQRLASCPQ